MKRDEIHIRDPFVFAENGKYYLLGTTGGDPWERGSDLVLYVSEDLEQFEKKCVLVTDDSLSSYQNIWAPELHKYRDKYYLIVSAYRADLGRGSIILVSDALDENFKRLTGEYITPKGWGCLDATLFVYRNKPYLCFSNEWTTPVSHDGDGSLFIAEMKEDLTALIGQPQKIISGKQSGIAVEIGEGQIKGYVAEGPWLYGENGKIVLLWSTIGKNGYMVVRSISANGVFGEYIFDKILFDRDGGHCMCFTDFKGERVLALHQPNVSPEERMRLFSLRELG